MNVTLLVNNAATVDADYISWAPSECNIVLTDPDGGVNDVDLLFRNRNTNAGGQVVFFDDISNDPSDEFELSVTADGNPVTFFVAGKFGFPSTDDKDAAIEIVDLQTGAVLFTKELMVRIRKNANLLSPDERDRFLNAFSTLNRTGAFRDFRDMHTNRTSEEAHGNAGFLPWHRAYLLDLERELQKIDASVSLPYWKFDEPAPNLFHRDFFGVSNMNGRVRFSTPNPLNFWSTDGTVGISRSPFFNTSTAPALVINELDTINLGRVYSSFLRMEGDPHGAAHVSFDGFIGDINTAARDPLFFLLHANVDRLWAKWQWLNDLFDTSNRDAYPFQGTAGSSGATRIGHNLRDSMWPWNQVTGSPRPSGAPGGGFPGFLFNIAPSSRPVVGDMIDYQGKLNARARLGFDYDDVPFEN